jgi:hypothetical protein
MCNARRIRITATRQLDQAWQREVSRSVDLCTGVVGEARVRQPLDATLGGPALNALEAILAGGESGWTEVDQGYRFDVEGGYVIYLVDERALEIVAQTEDVVQATGEASTVLEGQVREEVSVQGVGKYYDDGYGGHTPERAQEAAEKDADTKLDNAAQAKVEDAQKEAEDRESGRVEAEARAKAQEQLQQRAAQRQEQLEEQARQHLETVGLRSRQAFHRVLAQAYRDAILTYARRQGAEGVVCNENEDSVEIEFSMSA